jgi:hypothetical protein
MRSVVSYSNFTFHSLSAALKVLRTQSETVCLLALVAAVNLLQIIAIKSNWDNAAHGLTAW